MITREQVLTNEMVLGIIRGLDDIFSKFNLQSLLFNPKKKSYQISDKIIVQIDTDKLFVDFYQNIYLYTLAVTYNGICVDANILFDNNANILEASKNKSFPGNWSEVKGCQFCCETTTIKNGNDTIDINYCPICGRKLIQGKPMLYRNVIDFKYNNEGE